MYYNTTTVFYLYQVRVQNTKFSLYLKQNIVNIWKDTQRKDMKAKVAHPLCISTYRTIFNHFATPSDWWPTGGSLRPTTINHSPPICVFNPIPDEIVLKGHKYLFILVTITALTVISLANKNGYFDHMICPFSSFWNGVINIINSYFINECTLILFYFLHA